MQPSDAIVVGGCSADVELDEISFSWPSTRNCLAQTLGSCTARIKFGLVEAFGQPHYGRVKVEVCRLMSQFWLRVAFVTPMARRRIVVVKSTRSS